MSHLPGWPRTRRTEIRIWAECRPNRQVTAPQGAPERAWFRRSSTAPDRRRWDLESDGLWLPKGGWMGTEAFGPLGGGASGARLTRPPKRTSRLPGSGPQHCRRSV
jgi:hypothetical protein